MVALLDTEVDEFGNPIKAPSAQDNLKAYLQNIMNTKRGDEAGLVEAQRSASEGAQGLGIMQAGETIGRALAGAAPAQGTFDTYREANKQKLNDYLSQVKAGRDEQADQMVAAKTLADMQEKQENAARDELRWTAEMKLKNKIANQKPAPREPVTPFEKAKAQAQAKAFSDVQNKADSAKMGAEAVDSAINAFETYSRKKTGGTGPLATLGGATKYFSEDTETLDTKFKDQALLKMTTMFQGMSKAVDSNAERRAFEATVPSITKDDQTNRERLYGLKAAALRVKAEAAAQQAWLDSGNPDMGGYRSPNERLSTVVNASGEMELVPKGNLPEGYMKLDDFIKKGGGAPAESEKSYLSPEKQKRIDMLRAKKAAGNLQ